MRTTYSYELPESLFDTCPDIYQDLLTAIKVVRLNEPGFAKIVARDALIAAIERLAEQYGKDDEDQLAEIVTFLYWNFQSSINVSWIYRHFGLKSSKGLYKVLKPLTLEFDCPSCKTRCTMSLANRDAYENAQIILQSKQNKREKQAYYCPDCKKELIEKMRIKRQEEQAKYEKEQEEKEAQLAEVRARIAEMTYQEYLQSPVWKEVRAWAKRVVRNRCQNCENQEYPLYVNRINNLAIRGEEKITDLLILCSDCHQRRYENIQQWKATRNE